VGVRRSFSVCPGKKTLFHFPPSKSRTLSPLSFLQLPRAGIRVFFAVIYFSFNLLDTELGFFWDYHV